MSLLLMKSNKGCHKLWFYLKNDAAAPLPVWGPVNKEKKRMHDHLKAIVILKDRGLRGTGVIGTYHMRRVVPLMVHALLMHRITLDSPP
jgi:hypothetical protein